MIDQPYVVTTLKGIVEALTEFLPVSSTGHLFLMNFAMHFPNTADFAAPEGSKVTFMDFFDIFIQFGAILAVIVEYRRSLWSRLVLALSRGEAPLAAQGAAQGDALHAAGPAVQDHQAPATPVQARRFWLALIVGTLPVLAVGYACKGFLDGVADNPQILLILASAWIFGGIVMWVNELRPPLETRPSVWDIDLKTATWIGLLQCIAMWPGISRSAATIIAGRRFGMSKQAAAEFSFFLAVPALTAASAYKLLKYYKMLNGHNIGVLVVGTLISFVGAWLVIRLFLAFLRKFSFVSFAAYRVVLGLAVLGLYLGGWRKPVDEIVPVGAPAAMTAPAVPAVPMVPAAPLDPVVPAVKTTH